MDQPIPDDHAETVAAIMRAWHVLDELELHLWEDHGWEPGETGPLRAVWRLEALHVNDHLHRPELDHQVEHGFLRENQHHAR
jgi:hypothetical protein